MPDIELVLVDALSSALGSSYSVTWERPDLTVFDNVLPTKTLVVLNRIGGLIKNRTVTDRPVVDFDLYALSHTDVNLAVVEVRAAVEALRNTVWPTAVIAGVYEESGPVPRPENNPSVYRRGFTFSFIARRNAST